MITTTSTTTTTTTAAATTTTTTTSTTTTTTTTTTTRRLLRPLLKPEAQDTLLQDAPSWGMNARVPISLGILVDALFWLLPYILEKVGVSHAESNEGP